MKRVGRVLAVLRFRRELKRCGDFLLDDPPPDAFVREPRRPRPPLPGGAIALELPDFSYDRPKGKNHCVMRTTVAPVEAS